MAMAMLALSALALSTAAAFAASGVGHNEAAADGTPTSHGIWHNRVHLTADETLLYRDGDHHPHLHSLHPSEGTADSPEGYYLFVLRHLRNPPPSSVSPPTTSLLHAFRLEFRDLLAHDDYHRVAPHAYLVFCHAGEAHAFRRRAAILGGSSVVQRIHRIGGAAGAGALVKLERPLQLAVAAAEAGRCDGCPKAEDRPGSSSPPHPHPRAATTAAVKLGIHLAWRTDAMVAGDAAAAGAWMPRHAKLRQHVAQRGHLHPANPSHPANNSTATLDALRSLPRQCVVDRKSDSALASLSTTSPVRSVFLSVLVPAVASAGGDAEPMLCHCRQLLQELALLPFVRWIEVAPRFDALNSVATKTVQHPSDYSRPLWHNGLTGRGQLVAVGDTGLDYDSCYFRDDAQPVAFYPATNPTHRKILSYQECRDDGVPPDHVDRSGAHGTHVSGSLAGHAPGQGSDFNGLAKDAVMFFQDLTCSGDNYGLLLPPDPGDYYEPAYGLGARISSNSWGSGESPKSYCATDRLTDQFAYLHQDYLVVFAAGNNPNAGVLTPGSSKNALTVGAHPNTLNAGERESLASYSAHGPTFDGRLKPEIVGPGGPVSSAMSDGQFNSNQCDLTSKSGTSMATPFVAAAAVLLRQYLAEGYHPSGVKNTSHRLESQSASAMKALLLQAGVRMTASAGSGFPNANQGFGRLELNTLCHMGPVSHPHMHIMDDPSRPAQHQATRRFCFAALSQAAVAASPSGRVLKVTLAWMDSAAAAEGSTRSQVNDLDLVVVAGDGTVHHANGLPSGLLDRNNNVEQVWLTSVPDVFFSKPFQVLVYGHDVQDYGPYDGQPFAVVVWGPGITPAASDGICDVCPAGCSGRGTCVGGQCQCNAGYGHVACSLCDGGTVCSGNGQCDSALRCTCGPTINRLSPDCSTCAAGWYGPHCDGTCKCLNGGTCNETSGRCRCAQDRTVGGSGCWSHTDCSRCCEDFGGPQCNQRSFWCHNKQTRALTNLTDSGLIQINGDPQYPTSTACRWRLAAMHPGWRIRLTFVSFKTEDPYDYLKLFDGPSGDDDAKLVKRYTGSIAANSLEWTSTTADAFLYFQSDMLQDDMGFVLRFDVLKQGGCDAVNCHGRGTCDGATLACLCQARYDSATACSTCVAGWSGVDCAVPDRTAVPQTAVPRPTEQPRTPAPSAAPAECSSDGGGGEATCRNGGVCGATAPGRCACPFGFTGFRCSEACPAWQDEATAEARVCNRQLQPGATTCLSSAACGPCADGFTGAACQVAESSIDSLRHGGPLAGVLTVPRGATLLASEWDRRRWVLLRFNVTPLATLGIATGLQLAVARANVTSSSSAASPLRVDVCVWDHAAFVYNASAAAACFRHVPLPASSVAAESGLNLSVALWPASAVVGLRLSSPASAAAAAADVDVLVRATEVSPPASLSECLSPRTPDDSSSSKSDSLPALFSAAMLCAVSLDTYTRTSGTGPVPSLPFSAGSSGNRSNSLFVNALQNREGIAAAAVGGFLLGLAVFLFFWLRDRKKHRMYATVGVAAAAPPTQRSRDAAEDDDESVELEAMPRRDAAAAALEVAAGKERSSDKGDVAALPSFTATASSMPRDEDLQDFSH